jgi:Bacterial regulatory proteins, luxR family
VPFQQCPHIRLTRVIHGNQAASHHASNVAEAMVLSPTTAKTHVSRAMIKLGARDRAQLAVFAYQAGLVTPRAAG